MTLLIVWGSNTTQTLSLHPDKKCLDFTQQQSKSDIPKVMLRWCQTIGIKICVMLKSRGVTKFSIFTSTFVKMLCYNVQYSSQIK